MTAWGTTAKSNFDQVSKVQNQATRIITGAMKSMPIMELETITGLQSLDDRRDHKLLSQAAKFKRLQDHPMRHTLSQPTKGRLKRESFIHQSRILERRQEDILDHDPKEIPPMSCRSCLEWVNFSHHSVYYPRCWSERLPKRSWEKVPHSGITWNQLPERVLDSWLHWWLCWECSSEWRGRSRHPVHRRQRRQN